MRHLPPAFTRRASPASTRSRSRILTSAPGTVNTRVSGGKRTGIGLSHFRALSCARLNFSASQWSRSSARSSRRGTSFPVAAVAVLGEPLARLDDDASAPILPRGQPGSARLAFHLPAGEALALADEGFRPGRERLRHLLLEHGPHSSPTLSRWPLLNSCPCPCAWLASLPAPDGPAHRRPGRLASPR